MGKAFLAVAGVVILVMALGFGAREYQFQMESRYQPKYNDLSRRVFEHGVPYNQNMIDNLRREQDEYIHDTPAQQKVLGVMVLAEIRHYDDSDAPDDVRSFIAQVRRDQGQPAY